MRRTPIRVEPISTYLERRQKGPIYPVIVAGETVYVSILPPFDPQTGEIKRVPFAIQSELVLEQMRCCLEAAGSSLDRVLKCNVYRTPDESHFGIFNEVYSRYFPRDAPARIFPHVPSWPLRYRSRLRGDNLRARNALGHLLHRQDLYGGVARPAHAAATLLRECFFNPTLRSKTNEHNHKQHLRQGCQRRALPQGRRTAHGRC